MTLSIVLPTIAGREDEVARTIAAYEEKTPVYIEWIFEYDHPTCAHAWNAGAKRATGTVLHLGNDDLEPETKSWYPAALKVLDDGHVPVGWIREDLAGLFGRDFCRAPLCRRAWFEPLPEVHYFSDNAFTDIMRDKGHWALPEVGYDFYHRRSMVGRDESGPRVARDHAGYQEWRRARL